MSALVKAGTPVEIHPCADSQVWVKREDLCCPNPGPSFSKIRGVAAHMYGRPEKIIGVLDTYHSKAGWAVAYACRETGKRAVVYWPRYKGDPMLPALPRSPQQKAHGLGAECVALKAGRSAILYHAAKADLRERFGPDAYMMPNALKLRETVEETAVEVARTGPVPPGLGSGTVVISVSSGTIAAGVLSGLAAVGLFPDVVLHLGYSRSKAAVKQYVEGLGQFIVAVEQGTDRELGFIPEFRTQIVDEGFGYKDAAGGPEPFPCNRYYDLKAWRWLERHVAELAQPVLFWNIGS